MTLRLRKKNPKVRGRSFCMGFHRSQSHEDKCKHTESAAGSVSETAHSGACKKTMYMEYSTVLYTRHELCSGECGKLESFSLKLVQVKVDWRGWQWASPKLLLCQPFLLQQCPLWVALFVVGSLEVSFIHSSARAPRALQRHTSVPRGPSTQTPMLLLHSGPSSALPSWPFLG